MSRFRLLVSESLHSLGANLSTTVAATMTVLIGMFLLGLFIALGSWVVSWSNQVKSDLIVKVFFEQDAGPKQIDAVRLFLLEDPRVKEAQFVSAQEALERMRERYPDLTRDLPSNPLPASWEVTPKNGDDVTAIGRAVEQAGLPGVDRVRWGEKTADRILQVARVIQIVFLAAVIVLLVASTLLIANTIRLSIFSRRREIEVMKLVGATNWFVRGPFMLEGLICGLIGSLAAVFLLLLGKELALPAILGHIDTSSGVEAMAFTLNALIIVVVGLALGAVGSGLTLRRFLQV